MSWILLLLDFVVLILAIVLREGRLSWIALLISLAIIVGIWIEILEGER